LLQNNYFQWFDQWFPLFGTISVAIFAMYLLLAVAKGNTKFGTRFFLIKVHPMEPGKTLLNALIFNVALVLLTVLPVTQFCTDAFSQYARLTDAQLIFGNQFKYLKFFKYFWQYNVFLFAILAITVLAAIYFSVCPSDRAHLQRVMDEIKARNKKNLAAVGSAIDRQGGSMSSIDVKKISKSK
jgi:LMBR1 domain-containing protein 1